MPRTRLMRGGKFLTVKPMQHLHESLSDNDLQAWAQDCIGNGFQLDMTVKNAAVDVEDPWVIKYCKENHRVLNRELQV